MVRASSGPITYSSPGPSCVETKDAGGRLGAPPPEAQPERDRAGRDTPINARESDRKRIDSPLFAAAPTTAKGRRRQPSSIQLRRPSCPQRVKIALGVKLLANQLIKISRSAVPEAPGDPEKQPDWPRRHRPPRSEEHTSELQSLMRNSYAVFCLKKKKRRTTKNTHTHTKKTS